MIKSLLFMLPLFVLKLIFLEHSHACTRVLYTASDHVVVVGRSMDWVEDLGSNLWIFPRGMERNGALGEGSIVWVSRYGSVITSGYETGTADGMNEKGLVANVLYLAESDYGTAQAGKPLLSILAWGQYALDNFATVAEAVEALKLEPFRLVAPILPNGEGAQLHLSLSDPTGDSAIFEYVRGVLRIHHGKAYQVMTNSPFYDEQLALNSYWQEIGGMKFLPGTSRAADRFARASFYLKELPLKKDPKFITAIPHQNFENQAIASIISLMRAVSVPLGFTTPGEPNIASTLWRTVSDQKNQIYYFDSATSPDIFWVDLKRIDFSEASGVRKLSLTGGKIYAGEVSQLFEKAIPFTFGKTKGGDLDHK